MKFEPVTRTEFLACIDPSVPEDKFAKTFVAKCDTLDSWGSVVALKAEESVMGALLVTYSKREPKCANLQLLHVFHKFRNRGLGRILCKLALQKANQEGCVYFRVSSEPNAVGFYRRIGVRFLGRQKSGTLLAVFRTNGADEFGACDYTIDEFVARSMHLGSKVKGAVVAQFGQPC